ncbi:ABC transporter ATP-binding protein [Treponema phagedenis]|uniref:ABC transporter ATP-binding protein n=1 Tax=Treponema phagedenis TaxID=162 RepID=UPI0001F6409B|nr:oligopeptide/dipeptide ABC transporter ATP-binding protein [Treponema phagedenis]EFW37288.1 ABC transporter, ATP-binding protein [Treponema phagedenis F0421]TYT77946.1 ATP-binding cassette domain-containing protein [Treponema phagedenis]
MKNQEDTNTLPETNDLLTVKDLKLHFPFTEGSIFKRKKGAIRAVDGISFSIKKGETLGLVGESGCGKSTAIRAIAQLYKPTSGSVVFKGVDLARCSKQELMRARKDMQMVFQDPYASLNPRMTAGSIIAEPLKILTKRGILSYTNDEITERVEVLMEKVGLSRFFSNRYPHEFSGGQRQRIGIARALALQPELILADEPVSALDVSIQAQILNLFKDLQEEFGLTYLFIAHDLAVIRYISTRIAVMYLGIIVEIADSVDLYKNPMHPYTEALLSAAPIPDPEIERKRQRIILSGDVPSPDQERQGCYFYDRCPKRMEGCASTIPSLQEGKTGHHVACFLYE